MVRAVQFSRGDMYLVTVDFLHQGINSGYSFVFLTVWQNNCRGIFTCSEWQYPSLFTSVSWICRAMSAQLYRISKLVDPTHVFKVNMNAKQLALNGFVIKPANQLVHQPTMVLVQGGIRAVKFYQNLMLKRIRWGENDPSNNCQLLWEGQIDNSTAEKWKVHQVTDEVESIRLLIEKKFQNFWQYMATS